jgi:hypothetical protein
MNAPEETMADSSAPITPSVSSSSVSSSSSEPTQQPETPNVTSTLEDDDRDFVLVLEENTKWPLLAETLAEIEADNNARSEELPTSGNVLIVRRGRDSKKGEIQEIRDGKRERHGGEGREEMMHTEREDNPNEDRQKRHRRKRHSHLCISSFLFLLARKRRTLCRSAVRVPQRGRPVDAHDSLERVLYEKGRECRGSRPTSGC